MIIDKGEYYDVVIQVVKSDVPHTRRGIQGWDEAAPGQSRSKSGGDRKQVG